MELFKKLCLGFLIVLLLCFLFSCGEDHTKKLSPHQKTTEEQANEVEQGREIGKKEGIGRGQGGPGRGKWRRTQEQVIEISPKSAKMIDIKVKPAVIKSMGSYISATGMVKTNENKVAIVGPLFSGRIKEFLVNVGDLVQKGSKLVLLESVEVAKAKTEFYKAYAEMELAKINYDRQQKLFKENITSKKDLASAEADYKIAMANLEAAEKNLHTLGFTEEDVQNIATKHEINPIICLCSPITGRVVKRQGVVGAMVDQSNDLLTVMDLSSLWIDADIYEKDIALINIGKKVEVAVTSYPREIFMGEVAYIGDIVNEETRTVTVRTVVNNKDRKLKVGMFANIRIYTEAEKKALVIPVDAVLDEMGEKIVFIKEGNAFRRKVVEVGNTLDSLVEIIAGLKEGEQVVVKGHFQLQSELVKKSGSGAVMIH
jgi:cobalt-zinc-cadmium efflux system membrane fusion protein